MTRHEMPVIAGQIAVSHFNRINYIPGDGRVTIQNNVEYAAIHIKTQTLFFRQVVIMQRQ